jgi:EmrB/QacA subfamily drug resistance transporter
MTSTPTTADPAAAPPPRRSREDLAPVAPQNAEAAPLFTHRQILVILAGLMSGMFLAALDQTIVSTSIRTIADDLSGLSLQAWATTAYLITATISTPLYGKLSDLYGRRPLFLTAISIFIFGSILSGFAQTMYQLAAFRGVQGLGAGGLMALALAIIGDIVPPRERARYQGFFLAVFGTSSVIGPVVGGFLAGQETILGIDGWRWVFLINVPIGIFALALVAKVLHLPHVRRDHRIDWPGALALIVGLVPLLLAAEQGREWGWTSTRTLACFAVGALGVVAFMLSERYFKDDALLPLRLFRGKTFSVGSGLNTIIGMGMFGGLAMLPLYLQIVKGKSPTESGLLLLPLVMGIMAGSIFSGQVISRSGKYRKFPIIGSGMLTVALFLMATIGTDTSIVYLDIFALLFGLGLGFNMQPLILAVQNAVPAKDMGVATSSSTFFRQLGGTVGTAVFLSVLFSTVSGRITDAFRSASGTADFQAAINDPAVLAEPANAGVVQGLKSGGGAAGGVLNDSRFLDHLDERLARPFLDGFASSMDLVFLLAAGVMALAFALTWFLPEEKLRNESGIAAAQADAAREAAGEAEREAEREAAREAEREAAREAEPEAAIS